MAVNYSQISTYLNNNSNGMYRQGSGSFFITYRPASGEDVTPITPDLATGVLEQYGAVVTKVRKVSCNEYRIVFDEVGEKTKTVEKTVLSA